MAYTFGDITIAPTHVERVVFPEVGVTKGDVIAYYADVAAAMLPKLAGRPLTLERFTKGIAAGGFYQKHWQKHYPAWIDRIELRGKTPVIYPICDTPAALVYFANQGAIAFHVMTTRAAAPERPDVIVFDLDPPEDGLALVRRGAHLLHAVLDELALPAFVKTTGSKGLHVIVPTTGDAGFREIEALSSALAGVLCARHPDVFTTEFYKKDRRGRLFLDIMRNTPGATFVAPYSLRGRANAPVSAPITWDEVDHVAPDGITLRDVHKRLDRGDPWHGMRAAAASVTAVLARLRS